MSLRHGNSSVINSLAAATSLTVMYVLGTLRGARLHLLQVIPGFPFSPRQEFNWLYLVEMVEWNDRGRTQERGGGYTIMKTVSESSFNKSGKEGRKGKRKGDSHLPQVKSPLLVYFT